MVRNLVLKLLGYNIELNNKGKDLLQSDLALSDSIFWRDDVHLSTIQDVSITHGFFSVVGFFCFILGFFNASEYTPQGAERSKLYPSRNQDNVQCECWISMYIYLISFQNCWIDSNFISII